MPGGKNTETEKEKIVIADMAGRELKVPIPANKKVGIVENHFEKEDWKRCIEFHGHVCPSLAIGYRACEALMERFKVEFSRDEELVCVTENDACGVDAVQVLTGCTFGKGNLIYRGTGKMAFSFFKRNTGESIRIVYSPSKNFEDRQKKLEYIMTAPLEELFQFKKPNFPLPERARIFRTVI